MTYPGGKSGSGVYQALINLIPPHSVYVEPFLGGGAVMRCKLPARLSIGIDLDPDVIAGWSTSSGGGAGSGGAGLDRPSLNPAARDRQSPNPAAVAGGIGGGS